ncbi:MAG: ATPase [Candidatus Solibacter sp.]|nr:ATPase [Candidatus Solibacter sp.]
MGEQASNGNGKFPVVGIGASAGGLEAFLEFFSGLRPPSGMGFVLVTHLEPAHESSLAEILSRATTLPVIDAVEGARVEPDHVYVLPPNAEITIREGVLRLSPRAESLNPHYPIDRFLESLAEDQGDGAIGVILSGGGSDGAQGVRAVKSRGGTTFCQDPQTARHPSMPHAAAETGAVDFIQPPDRIAREIQKLHFDGYLAETPSEDEAKASMEERNFSRILSLLRGSHGVDFSLYKPSTIVRRLGRRMLIHHLASLSDYVKLLENHPAELDDLYRDLLICVTSFFREPEMFDAFRGVLSRSLDSRKSGDPYRIWVAGCATGEETYSFAIALTEAAEAAGKRIPLQVFGTDVSDESIERARSGVFPENVQQSVSAERLRRFFVRVDSGYRIAETIRHTCVFARHDITADPPFSHMDLITCRNVLIYLGSSIQDRILQSLHYGLNTGGTLVLGSAETIGNRSDLFATIDQEHKIFLKKAVPSRLGFDFGRNGGAPAEVPELIFPVSRQAAAEVDVEGRAARILRDLYAPPGLIVNDDMQVLEVHGHTGFYLEPAMEDTRPNLMRLARPSLLPSLRTLVDQARETKRPAAEAGVEVEHRGEVRKTTLRVVPLDDARQHYLVLFEGPDMAEPELRNPESTSVRGTAGGTAVDLQLAQAYREMAQLREYLRKATEQYEAATEELKAANEEARSANEELQSTNEELRTAKEELQSSNEELTTVNDELKHRNEELRLSNDDLTNVLGAATIPILMVGMDLRLRRFTPAAERLLRLGPSDVGQPIANVQHGFKLLDVNQKLRLAIEHLEIHHERAQDRQGRWFEVFVRPFRTVDNRIEGAVISFIDIDDLVRALHTAETARNFAEAIVNTVQHPLVVLNADLRIIRATEAFYKMFQVAPGETEGQLLSDSQSGQWMFPELMNLLDAALVRDVPFRDLEVEHEFPHLGRRTLRLNARRITGRDHQPHRLLLAIEDVTERKETAELQYRRLFESAKDGILILDAASGLVMDANPYFSELTRYQRSEVLGKRFGDLEPFLEAEESRRLVQETSRDRSPSYESVRIHARDGKHLVVAIIATQYQLKDKDFIQVNIRDVTERRRMEERLRRTNLDLQQFAFAASHDLQEPLRTVVGFSQLLKHQNEGKLGADADKHLDYIVTAADRMSQMVLDLLGFSQVARAETNPVSVNVESVLATAILNLQMAIRDTRARITFDHLPTVRMDPTMLLQLLQNLLGNSIKYRGEAPPEIHLAVREQGEEWVFSVRDNGLGIDPKYGEHIFTVFKRLHGREYPGMGIGLAICKRIVERHGGTIWVESELGKGSTFYFTVLKQPRHGD